MDETTIGLLCYLTRCWMRKGEQKRIDTPGQQQWHNLFGAYNWRTDEVITLTADKKNSTAFCHFIEHLMQSVPDDRPSVIVLDNASYHHSQVSQATLAYFEDQALFFFLPPYCSDLNPIERFWRHLKENACSNKLFRSVLQMVESIHELLLIQNDTSQSERFLYSKT